MDVRNSSTRVIAYGENEHGDGCVSLATQHLVGEAIALDDYLWGGEGDTDDGAVARASALGGATHANRAA